MPKPFSISAPKEVREVKINIATPNISPPITKLVNFLILLYCSRDCSVPFLNTNKKKKPALGRKTPRTKSAIMIVRTMKNVAGIATTA